MSAAGLWRRPVYRARQVLWALWPGLSVGDRREIEEFLGARLSALFASMEAADQRHGLDVYRAARRSGSEDRDLLTAALIHDCGKAPCPDDGRVRLWHRVAYVTLETTAPGLLRRLARRPGGLRLLHRHAARGLELAEEYGAGEDVLRLMQAMEDGDPSDPRVKLLKAADDAA